jgi:hypothetical protein
VKYDNLATFKLIKMGGDFIGAYLQFLGVPVRVKYGDDGDDGDDGVVVNFNGHISHFAVYPPKLGLVTLF